MKPYIFKGIEEHLKGKLSKARTNIEVMLEGSQFSTSGDIVKKVEKELLIIAQVESQLSALSDIKEA